MSNLLNYATEVLLILFLAITFGQSGYDKLVDWKGNIAWLKGHFSATPVKNKVPLLLGIVLISEIVVALLCIGAIYGVIADGNTSFAFYTGIASCITLLQLLFGQRIAKDFDGARTIAIYFIPAILLVFITQ